MKPRMRLENVAALIIPADLMIDRFSSWAVGGAPAEMLGSDMNRILAERSRGVYQRWTKSDTTDACVVPTRRHDQRREHTTNS